MEVVDQTTWDNKWNSGSLVNGKRKIVASFISPKIECGSFRSLNVPLSFHTKYGYKLAPEIYVRCKNVVWKGRYKADEMKIYGLRRFMAFYGLSLFSIVQFDYYGDDIFMVKILKDTGMELNYPEIRPSMYWDSEDAEKWRQNQFIIQRGSVDYEENFARFYYSGIKNITEYYEIEILSSYLVEDVLNMSLGKKLEDLCSGQKDGSKVLFKLCLKQWEIEVKMLDGECAVGDSWHRFAKDTNIGSGDTLVLYKDSECNDNMFNVCIFKERKTLSNTVSGLWKPECFFKFVTTDLLDNERLVLSKIVKESFGEKLSGIDTLKVDDDLFVIKFYSDEDTLRLDADLLKYYKLRTNDFLLFQLDNSNIVHARVYQADGMEIDYYNRIVKDTIPAMTNISWNVDWSFCFETIEEEQDVNAATEDMDVASGNYSRYITTVAFVPDEKLTLGIPDNILSEIESELHFNTSIYLPIGRKIPAHYRKSTQKLTHLAVLKRQCKKTSGSSLMISYKGSGNFLIHIFDKEGSEVRYTISKQQPRDTICPQDLVDGTGWKFIANVLNTTLRDGQIDIPSQFFRRFRRVIPPYIMYALPGGSMFKGRYLKREKKLCDILGILAYTELEVGDVLMFTYWGAGQFDVVVFDKSKVEKNDIKAGESGDQAIIQNNADIEEEVEEQMDNIPRQFSVVMKKSNVNKTSHGVYIPKEINPDGRQWIAKEMITLRTTNGDWMVGITIGNGVARCSSGWNSFVKDNKIKKRQTLVFTMLPDQADGVVFLVELP